MTLSKVCDRTYGYGSATTVRYMDGVFLCVSCNQPLDKHKQVKQS